MASLKIISNPYKKEIRYQQLNEDNGDWVDINRSSKLLCKALTEGFFPFKAKQIVDQIVDDYGTGDDAIDIVFEGSADEYNELEAICAQESYQGNVSLNRSNLSLVNARDILPKVKELFQQMSPLIALSLNEKIQNDLNRFADAASDVVPICVLGNYSLGKSTFINALIGYEILPNGVNPVTAKVFKISKSKYPDRAFIQFQYWGKAVILRMTDKESYFESSQLPGDLIDCLKRKIIDAYVEAIDVRMNKAVKILNDYEMDGTNSGISDLIEIEIPFVNGVLAQSPYPFVIFDTPGSNSASNARHLKVLKGAMANMTNGLPIFLATPDTLDSIDNENLYKIIRDLDELDSRFTMIVVNKADKNDLNRKESNANEEKNVLDLAIPRNLYAGGIFYVSSILGLGAKSNGEFFDDFYDETYEDQEHKYNDPHNRRYKRLYIYNIMPSQIKARSDGLSATQANLVYANSGLYSVEHEIEQFAGKYAAYNKCFQSQLFLNRVIENTGEEISTERENCEGIRMNISDKLDEDKKKLIKQIEAAAESERSMYDNGYASVMSDILIQTESNLSYEKLKNLEDRLTSAVEVEYGFNKYDETAKNAANAIGQNLWQNIGIAAKNFSKSSLKSIAADFQEDTKVALDSTKFRSDMRHQVDQEVSKRLLANVKDQYRAHLLDSYGSLNKHSQRYWSENTERLRSILIQIVSGPSAYKLLTDDRMQEIKNIIISYQQITFDVSHAESVFQQGEFEKKFTIGGFVLWKDDHLNLSKLAKTYNSEVHEDIQRQYQSIEASHRESGHQWIQNLLDEIRSNIVKYSPELSRQAKQIQTMTKKIEELITRQAMLENYTVQLNTMMDWKITQG